MAISIIEDRVLGAAAHNDFEGVKLKRQFVVSGLPSASNGLFVAMSLAAVDASTGFRIPQYAEPHPTVTGQFVTGVDVDPVLNSNDKAQVTVYYGWRIFLGPLSIQVRISTSTCNVPVNWDPNTGKFFKIDFTYQKPAAGSSTLPSAGTGPTVPATATSNVVVNVLICETVVEITRLELQSPLQKINQIKGRTNASAWQGENAYQWLMRDVQAQSVANGAYLVTYVAAARPSLGWTQLAYYEDPVYHLTPKAVLDQTVTRAEVEGKPSGPCDGQDGRPSKNGIFLYNPLVYDFNTLSLPNVY